jgi:hypothetical protein
MEARYPSLASQGQLYDQGSKTMIGCNAFMTINLKFAKFTLLSCSTKSFLLLETNKSNPKNPQVTNNTDVFW